MGGINKIRSYLEGLDFQSAGGKCRHDAACNCCLATSAVCAGDNDAGDGDHTKLPSFLQYFRFCCYLFYPCHFKVNVQVVHHGHALECGDVRVPMQIPDQHKS